MFTNSYTISPSDESLVAIEVSKTGLRRRQKHILSFNRFEGELRFSENDPGIFKMTLTVDAASAVCHDSWLNDRKRRAVAAFACQKALEANANPEIRFTSDSIRSGVLRGFVITGILQIRGTPCVMNFSTTVSSQRNNCLQIDGDAPLRLGDFGLPRPSGFLGLSGTKDAALLRVVLVAVPQKTPEESDDKRVS